MSVCVEREVTYLLPAETKESENEYLINAAKISRVGNIELEEKRKEQRVGIWKLKSLKKGEKEARKSLERGPEKIREEERKGEESLKFFFFWKLKN